jgi:hypothetical protein
MALARRFSGTKLAAIVDPIDINTPCDRADRTRANNKTPTLVALAAILFPMIKVTMIQISRAFRDRPEVNDVKIGAPKVTPSAYMETVSPAVLTEMCKSSEIRGNNPTLINSVVPMAKALTAKESNPKRLLFLSFDIVIPPKYVVIFRRQMLL